MPAVILLAFAATAIVEVAVFVEVGGAIGLWPTLLAVVATAVTGGWLLRRQGLAALRRARRDLAAGRPPIEELFDGLCLLLAGALLLTPGFVTDAGGLALFVPGLRARLRRALGRRLFAFARVSPAAGAARAPGEAGVIEGRFEEVEPDDRKAGRR